MGLLRRAFAHPPRRWLLGIEALVTLLFARYLVARRPFSSYRHRMVGVQGPPRLSEEAAREIVWLVDRLSRKTPDLCLPRALSVQMMLARRGDGAEARFGVRRTEEGTMTAHVWLVWRDQVIIGALPHLDEYARLPTWPQGGGA